MKILGTVGFIWLICWFGGMPAKGHDWDHGDHCSGCDSFHGHHGRRFSGAPCCGQGLRTIEGRVAEMIYLPGFSPENAMVEVRLETTGQLTRIRLAPAGVLNKGEWHPREGDRVTIRGFPVAGPNGELIVATEIYQGGRSLALRDGRGRSLW